MVNRIKSNQFGRPWLVEMNSSTKRSTANYGFTTESLIYAISLSIEFRCAQIYTPRTFLLLLLFWHLLRLDNSNSNSSILINCAPTKQIDLFTTPSVHRWTRDASREWISHLLFSPRRFGRETHFHWDGNQRQTMYREKRPSLLYIYIAANHRSI